VQVLHGIMRSGEWRDERFGRRSKVT
jgi:hypothetical protein